MNLNFKEYGKGKTIVILHGLLGSLDNWSTIAKSLSTNYNIITIDLPDHGKSDHTDLFSYTSIVQSLKDFLIKTFELEIVSKVLPDFETIIFNLFFSMGLI